MVVTNSNGQLSAPIFAARGLDPSTFWWPFRPVTTNPQSHCAIVRIWNAYPLSLCSSCLRGAQTTAHLRIWCKSIGAARPKPVPATIWRSTMVRSPRIQTEGHCRCGI